MFNCKKALFTHDNKLIMTYDHYRLIFRKSEINEEIIIADLEKKVSKDFEWCGQQTETIQNILSEVKNFLLFPFYSCNEKELDQYLRVYYNNEYKSVQSCNAQLGHKVIPKFHAKEVISYFPTANLGEVEKVFCSEGDISEDDIKVLEPGPTSRRGSYLTSSFPDERFTSGIDSASDSSCGATYGSVASISSVSVATAGEEGCFGKMDGF